VVAQRTGHGVGGCLEKGENDAEAGHEQQGRPQHPSPSGLLPGTSATPTPDIIDRYEGTRGRTHGERKETIPAPKATTNPRGELCTRLPVPRSGAQRSAATAPQRCLPLPSRPVCLNGAKAGPADRRPRAVELRQAFGFPTCRPGRRYTDRLRAARTARAAASAELAPVATPRRSSPVVVSLRTANNPAPIRRQGVDSHDIEGSVGAQASQSFDHGTADGGRVAGDSLVE